MALMTISAEGFDPRKQLEIHGIGKIQSARLARCEPAKLNVLRVPQKWLRPRPTANQEDVIHACTICLGIGFRRRFETRIHRWDRTNLFFDLAEESFFRRLTASRVSTYEIPDAGIPTLRRGSASQQNASIANE
jgi:hypothetical protein